MDGEVVIDCTISGDFPGHSCFSATPPELWGFPQFALPGYCILVSSKNSGPRAMAGTREHKRTAGTYFGERDVEKRVYDALVAGGIAHHREMELCRELAALAGNMYQRQSLSDADIDEMLYAATQD